MLLEALRGKVAGDPVTVEGAERDTKVEAALVASGGAGEGAAEGSQHSALTDLVAGFDTKQGAEVAFAFGFDPLELTRHPDYILQGLKIAREETQHKMTNTK